MITAAVLIVDKPLDEEELDVTNVVAREVVAELADVKEFVLLDELVTIVDAPALLDDMLLIVEETGCNSAKAVLFSSMA